jgi:hypothetical protein
MTQKATRIFIIGTFVILYLLVSIISTIHVIDFFLMSNPKWLAVSLAIAFEVGAAASLASIITLDKMNKGIVWGLFILLTLMQAMGNTYYTYVHLINFQGWTELFGLVDEDLIYQKRVLSIVSGAILPIVALGFIKSLVDYIKPADEPVNDIATKTHKSEKEVPYVSDDFQIGPDGAYEHDDELVLDAPFLMADDHFSESQPEVEPSPEITAEPEVDNNNSIRQSRSSDDALARGARISFNDRI